MSFEDNFPGFNKYDLIIPIVHNKFKFSQKLQDILINNNIHNIYDLVSYSENELLKMKGIGEKKISVIKSSLNDYNLNLAYEVDNIKYRGKYPLAILNLDYSTFGSSLFLRNINFKEGLHRKKYCLNDFKKIVNHIKILTKNTDIKDEYLIKKLFNTIESRNNNEIKESTIEEGWVDIYLESKFIYMVKKSVYNNIQNYNSANIYLIKDLKYYYEKDSILIEYYLEVK